MLTLNTTLAKTKGTLLALKMIGNAMSIFASKLVVKAVKLFQTDLEVRMVKAENLLGNELIQPVRDLWTLLNEHTAQIITENVFLSEGAFFTGDEQWERLGVASRAPDKIKSSLKYTLDDLVEGNWEQAAQFYLLAINQSKIKSGNVERDIEFENKLTNLTLKFISTMGRDEVTLKTLPAVIENGLTSADVSVRSLSAMRDDYVATKEQIDRGLKDSHWEVRKGFAKRKETLPTLEQVIAGKHDDDNDVRIVFWEREEEWRVKRENASLKQHFQEVSLRKNKPL